jgi:hypothetical protein
MTDKQDKQTEQQPQPTDVRESDRNQERWEEEIIKDWLRAINDCKDM